ncbi:MAG: 4-hydroxythreonine-4-phosphate dehydrogenase PdxA [Firmicutes bacterium]|nr:4-hydroxythreonine-4-phosphate dehydrogenase PdxA [Bacillota bacterium]
MRQTEDPRIRVGISMGDPSGIGPEIIVKALEDPTHYEDMVPVIFGDPAVITRALRVVGSRASIRPVASAVEASGHPGTLEMVVTSEVRTPPPFGEVRPESGEAAVKAIMGVVEAAKRGDISVINTGPINKEAVRKAGYPFPGHTEMLAELFGVKRVLTMFIVGDLRVFFLTRHHPLKKAIDLITVDAVYEGIEQSVAYLHDLGFPHPTLAVAALNPHAGENGLIGTEEKEVLMPAVERAQQDGLPVVGPIPADAVFYQAKTGRYTAVLSLYHDQGHIATKTLDFHGTVSVTLGLPTVRTSVDHGTAFDIAGQGIADTHGQSEALRVAKELGRLLAAKG